MAFRFPSVNRNAITAILAMAFLAAAPAAAQSQGAGTNRVLLVGDDWTVWLLSDRSLRHRFAAEGLPDIWETGETVTLPGSTASDWAQPDNLQLIADELAAYPTIEVVQLTFGGNDIWRGTHVNGWRVGMTPGQVEALFDRILTDMGVAIDFILGLDPDLEVLISFYDYPRFNSADSNPLFALMCQHNFWEPMGRPSPWQINRVIISLAERVEASASRLPRVSMVRHEGLMQYVFGIPSQLIPPGQALPPGDPFEPSPAAAMRSGEHCIWLGWEGYAAIAENLWHGFYADFFCVDGDQWQGALLQWPAVIDLRALVQQITLVCR